MYSSCQLPPGCDNDIHNLGTTLHCNLIPMHGKLGTRLPAVQTDRQTHLHSQPWEVFVSQPHFNVAACCRTTIEAVVGYLGNKVMLESEI